VIHKIGTPLYTYEHSRTVIDRRPEAFLFRENRRHETSWQTDGRGATLNGAPYGGSHNKQVIAWYFLIHSYTLLFTRLDSRYNSCYILVCSKCR